MGKPEFVPLTPATVEASEARHGSSSLPSKESEAEEPGDQGKPGYTASNKRTVSESVSCPVQPSTMAHIRTSPDSLLPG